MDHLETEVRAGKTPWVLWWSLVAGFFAWTVDLGLSYVLEQHSCFTGHYYVLHVIPIVSLVIALSGFASGLTEFSRIPNNTSEEGGTPFDRAHFQALLGMAFSLWF